MAFSIEKVRQSQQRKQGGSILERARKASEQQQAQQQFEERLQTTPLKRAQARVTLGEDATSQEVTERAQRRTQAEIEAAGRVVKERQDRTATERAQQAEQRGRERGQQRTQELAESQQDTETEVSAPDRSFLERIGQRAADVVPENVRDVGEDIAEGLLPRRDTATPPEEQPISEQGVLGFFAPTLVDTQEQVFERRRQEARERGVDENRASEIAAQFVDDSTLTAPQKTENLSETEREAIEAAEFNERLETAFTALDAPTFGAAGFTRRGAVNVGEEVLSRLARSTDESTNFEEVRRFIEDKETARKVARVTTDANTKKQVNDAIQAGAQEAAQKTDEAVQARQADEATTQQIDATQPAQARTTQSQRGTQERADIPTVSTTDEATDTTRRQATARQAEEPDTRPERNLFSESVSRKISRSKSEDEFAQSLSRTEADEITETTSLTPEAAFDLARRGQVDDIPAEDFRSFSNFVRETAEEGRDLPQSAVDFARRLGISAQDTRTLQQNAQKLDRAVQQLTQGTRRRPSPRPDRVLGRDQPRRVSQREDVAVRERFRQQSRGSRSQLRQTTERRSRLKAVQNEFNLTDKELRQIRAFGDIRTMSDREFDEYMDSIAKQAQDIHRMQQLRSQVKGTIWEKQLQKTENLRRAMGFPPVSRMNDQQLTEFDQLLSQYKEGDEFLRPRQLETVENTDLSGMRTIREARETIANKTGRSLDEIQNIEVGELDKFTFDAALARKNPFYEMMVDQTHAKITQADVRFTQFEEELNDVISRARKSRKRSIIDRLVPMDRRIWDYLEAEPPQKQQIRDQMTKEEFEAAEFVRKKYEEARDYLIQHEALDNYRSNYITHIRRGFLEAWVEEGPVKGLMQAFREMFQQHVQDQQVFKILDDETDQVLPLEKFFSFSMRRSGNLTPSKNVAKAVSAYFQQFERKKALDALVPHIDIFAHSLTPKTFTPTGKEADQSIKKFYKEWLNTKKGRRSSKFIQPGGKLDWATRASLSLTRTLDLGFSFTTQAAAPFGEAAANAISLGFGKTLKASARRRALQVKDVSDALVSGATLGKKRVKMSKGQRILEKYKGFVGRTPWDGLKEASENVGNRFMTLMFSGFQQAHVGANKTALLASMSKDEWANETVSPERLAEMKRQMNKWRSMNNTKSISGATTEGEVINQYKSWAIPMLFSTVQNVADLKRQLLRRPVKETIQSQEFQETLRQAIITGVGGVTVYNLIREEPEDRTFVETMIAKAGRDALSAVGALDPRIWLSVPRTVQFLDDFGQAIFDLGTLEEYKTKEGFKGVEQLKDIFTPQAVEQFAGPEDASETTGGVSVPEVEVPEVETPEVEVPTVQTR